VAVSVAFVERLAGQLDALRRERSPTGFAVAYSGGLDSAVLLAGCVRVALQEPLRALHVNHRLHAESDAWAEHCAAEAARLGVDFDCVTVQVPRVKGHSLEATARELRYAGFAERLRPGEMLLTAHHADDQLETVLLRLLRGAGVRGLCGILPGGELGAGYFGRPLLEFKKADLVAVAHAWDLSWLEDPSNADRRFDRNYLRGCVVPQIKARWPSAAVTVGRTAHHMRDAQALLAEAAAADVAALPEPRQIPLELLRGLDGAHRRNVVRARMAALGLPMPSADQLDALLAMVDHARSDAEAVFRWPDAEAHFYGGQLYLLAALPAASPHGTVAHVSCDAPWSGPEGEVALVGTVAGDARAALSGACVSDGLELRFRSGGERIKPAFGRHHRKLKTLLQEARIVPWMRSRIPLLYQRDTLVAVGDLWIDEAVRERRPGAPAWCVRWSGHPVLR